MKETISYNAKENGFIVQLPYGELHVSGDDQHGYRPYQLLVSSVAVCSGGTLRKILQKQRLEVEDITLKAEVTRKEEGAQEIEKIHTHYIIKGRNLDPKKVEKAMALAHKNCSMAQSVKGSIQLTESFEIIESI